MMKLSLGTIRHFIPAILTGIISLGALQTPAQAGITKAGTPINNRAIASYTDGGSGFPSTLQSNTVTAEVQPLEGLQLAPSQTVESPLGAPINLSHKLTNTGNVASSYKISVSNLSGDDYDVTKLNVYLDLNDNGIADVGEPEVGSQTPTLESGASLSLVVNGFAPPSAAAQTAAKVELSATTTLQSEKANNTDVITVASALSLQVFKAASVPHAEAGSTVTFTLTALNRGSSAPTPLAVDIDGAPRKLVLLRDALPANTSLVSFDNAGTGTPLYHRLGDAAQSYLSKAPQNLDTVDAVAYAVPRFAPATTLKTAFMVRLHRNLSGDIRNTAQLLYGDASSAAVQSIDSNEVDVTVPVQAPSIRYYTGASFKEIATSTNFNWPLYLELNAGWCNKDAQVIERIKVRIGSLKTGDIMYGDAIETGPNTGIFRLISTPLVKSQQDNLTDNLIETVSSDNLTASFICNGQEISTMILVDPLGVVYDSRSNAPVAGARVTLIDVTGRGNGGRADGEAIVFDFDGARAPSSVVTDASGQFQFPRVNESTYRLAVVAPTNFTFPSKIPAGLQPLGRVVDVAGSYGGNFPVTIAGGAVQIDVPLDSSGGQAGLFIEKTTTRIQAEVGDFVDYELRLKNSTAVNLTRTVITDTLPTGFRFQSGTARLAGVALAPSTNNGRDLTFETGALAIGAEVRLTYRVLIGPGTKLGKNFNRARAVGTASLGNSTSNEAAVATDIQGGVFNDKGIILGRVWVDTNHDGTVQEDEPGIPGVRLFLEDGTFAVTDENGKYSIYGLEPRTHVVKVDTTTLPRSVKLQVLSSRYGKNGQSYMVDLKKGELHKVNFADGAAADGIFDEIKTRRTRVAQSESESFQSLRTTLTPDGTVLVPGDVRGLPASGMVSGSGIIAAENNASSFGRNPVANTGENGGTGLPISANALPLDAAKSNLPTSPAAKVPSVDLESLLPTLNSDLGFADLKDGDTLALAQANVRVKGTAGSTFVLKVNGVEFPAKRVGLKASNEQIEAWEYVGVKMQPGSNTLQVEQVDGFGIARGKASITVIAPGDLGRLEVSAPTKNLFADGRTQTKISVRLLDNKGAIVSSRTAVTLEAAIGQWQVADLNATEPGVQVFIEGGRGEFSLLAPTQAGDCTVRVSSGILRSNLTLSFVPELRPLIVSGVATAKLNLFGFNARGAGALRTEEIFENEDKARGALFVKGRILGSSLLTLRYDSQKKEDDRLFRDIQPDAYYPIYGDSSARGFDAQSTSKLYVRVDQNKSYVLYGDYTTSGLNTARSLGDYNRSFTGLKLHRETDRFSANLFASRDSQRQIVDEIRGNGTSGRYLLRAGDIREQSEKVEIIVRDRNQPSVVLSTTPQTRFVDYTLDGFSQGIIFRSPVPSFDSNLNPVYIRVTYEVEQGGPNFTVAGGDAQFQVNNKLNLGGAYSTDRNPQAPFSLRSINATYRFAASTTLVGEWAQSKRGEEKGGAQRIELLHEGTRLAARLFWGRSDAGFDNPAALLSQGRQEATLKATYKVDGSNRIVAEALRSKDVAGNGTRSGAQLSLEHSFDNNVRVEVGVRKVKDSGTPLQSGNGATPADFTSLRAKVTAPVPNMPQANLFAEYEKAVQGDGQVLTVGGDYQIANRGRLYLRHELISSLSGRYGLNDTTDQHSTLIGMDADYMKNGRVFSEYRVGGGISGRDAEAALGLRNTWNLGEGLRANTSFERIKDMGGTSGVSNNSIAVTGGLEYTRSPNFKGTARMEVRNGDSSDSILGTVGAAYKISPSFSLLGKGVYSKTNSASATGSTGVNFAGQNQRRALIGLSYRSSKNDRLQALLKYEYRGETGSLSSRLRRRSQIVSANVNYQASRRWNLSGHYALKSGYDQSNGLSNNALLQLLSGRATYNMGRRADLSLLGSVFRGGGAAQTGLGAEVGFRLTSNLRLSAGYLLGRFRANDLPDIGGSDSGFYLRFGYEFDEDLLGGGDLQ
jgi:uncharacterized repeat protein (TIGR01451 family)